MKVSKDFKYYIGIFLLASLVYIPLIGKVHLFDWDEINFAESAREMIETGDYLTVQINYTAFWEKPPLFFWMQTLSMKIFGVNEFAARFPNAICGILTLLILFRIGKRLRNKRFGLLWVASMGASILPFLYFKSGIIDPWFNLLIFLGIHYFISFYQNHKDKDILLSGTFIGLAVLTKGPAGFLIYGLTIFIYLIFHRFKIKFNLKQLIYFTMAFAFTGGFWFILQILNGNWDVIQDFIVYQIRLFKTKDAGHGGFLLYHFVILLIGVFPASIFALRTLTKRNIQNENLIDYTQWMKILFWVVLILFTIVKTKIVHYSSLCYFPLTYLSARFLEEWVERKDKITWYQHLTFYVTTLFFVILAIGIPLIGLNKDSFISLGIINDDFTIANLQANILWSGWEFTALIPLIVGIVIFLYHKNKNRTFALSSLYINIAIFTFLFLILNINKIEGYSQRTVIDFYKSKVDEDCYIKTMYYKSYAPFFYQKKKAPDNYEINRDEDWLLRGDIDKTVYFVARIMHRKQMQKLDAKDLHFIEEKNGFLFFKRDPQKDD